ncbi:hypothetical protein [Lihuaxuella thermophila]|uniref:histidine kinase n=1 Tax=Lihuaxuella thermophila TaxID=1173111 RepID=A0A1H8GWI5_9BACL|nr:hypothetical protein [Lihuaxuella thermophila]SEN48180.1 hypothetical protein SAMN05444955_11299 [Lihuaxuella thermophila]
MKIKEAVKKIRLGQYRSFCPLKRKDELGAMSHELFEMSGQMEERPAQMKKEEKLNEAWDTLKELERKQKRLIGSIGHEFKTPLTVMKAYVDLMDGGSGQDF